MGPERTTLGDGTILLRPWTLGDVERVAEICADPEIPRWTTVPSPYRREHAESWIERTIRDWDDRKGEASFAIVDAAAGLVIGAIGLRFTDARGSVGYWVAREARGCGVATRAVEIIRDWAFVELGLPQLELVTDPDNVASQRIAEKAGFRRRRLLRRHVEVRGERRDVVLFAAEARALDPARGGNT